MTRTIARTAALLAAVSCSLVGTVAVATSAAADDATGQSTSAAVLSVAPTPVDPQPLVAGHEGDVLMHVYVAMPAKALISVRKAKHSR